MWDDGTWQPLAPLAGDATADVCVIGLGASGLCAVIEAASLGLKVVGIDSTRTAGGAAGANGGILRAGVSRFHHDAVQSFGRTRAVALYKLTAGEIARMVEETPDAVRRTGSLRVAAGDAEWAECETQLGALRADGVAVEHRDTPFGRGIFIPSDAAVQPLVRGRSLALQAIACGARLFEQTHALGFTGNEVRTPGGRIRCGSVVVAVDGERGHGAGIGRGCSYDPPADAGH